MIYLVYEQELKLYGGIMYHSLCIQKGSDATVNTKNWYRKEPDLWAEFGNEMPFGRKNLLRGFGKDACGRQYAIIR
jgi:hypothetical protein